MEPLQDAQSPQDPRAIRRLLEQLVAGSPIAMAVLDGAEYRFRIANPAFAILAGGRPLIGCTYAEVFPDLAPAHLPSIDHVYRVGGGATIDDASLTLDRGRGPEQSRWRFSFTPLYEQSGAIVGVQCYAVEATWRAAEMLAEQEKDAFLSIASHELRTPLTTLKGLTQIAHRRLATGHDLGKARANLAMASQQIVRLEELLNKILDTGRIKAGELPLAIERCDLSEIVRVAVLRAQATTDRHTIKLKGDEVALPIDADSQKIEQVLINLLYNAIKFDPQGGRIEVTIEASGDRALVRVCDSGIGIPSEGRARLFEPFYRGPNASLRHFSGLGIGLYLSLQIAQRHGGRLWLEATGESGSVFALELPIAAEPG